MSNLAIIPARGGSKRIPRKNIKEFLGKPIIAYSIEAALKSDLFDEVMVSTDDREIAVIAQSYGASVPFLRSSSNADDHATTAEVVAEVLERYDKEGKNFENACCIYPCSPLLQKQTLQKAYKTLQKGFETVFPIVSFAYPVQRALKTKDEKVFWSNPENALVRSQDLETCYHDSGQFYWLKVSSFRKEGKLIAENSGFVALSDMEAQDIDTETDWKLAELKYKLMHEMAD